MPTRTASDTPAGGVNPETPERAPLSFTHVRTLHLSTKSVPRSQAVDFTFWERMRLMRLDGVPSEPVGRFEAMYPEGGEPS